MNSGTIKSKKHQRRGAFTVEFAVVSSIFFVVLLGSFEFSRLFFVRHAIDQAAYEACRAGIVQGRTITDVEERAQSVLAASGINSSVIQVQPATFDEQTETVTVQITVNVADNSWIPGRFFTDPTVTTSMTLDHENQSYLSKPDEDNEVGDNEDEPIDT